MEPIKITINGNSGSVDGLWHDDNSVTVTGRYTWHGVEAIPLDHPAVIPPVGKGQDAYLLSYLHLDQDSLTDDQIAWLRERVIDYFASVPGAHPRLRNWAHHTCGPQSGWVSTDIVNLGGSCQRYMQDGWLDLSEKRKGSRVYLA